MATQPQPRAGRAAPSGLQPQVTLFSTLPKAKQEAFFNFFVEKDVKFFPTRDGKYVATIVPPNTRARSVEPQRATNSLKKDATERARSQPRTGSQPRTRLPQPSRLTKPSAGTRRRPARSQNPPKTPMSTIARSRRAAKSRNPAGVPPRFVFNVQQRYPEFFELIGDASNFTAKRRPIVWLARQMDAIYDAREHWNGQEAVSEEEALLRKGGLKRRRTVTEKQRQLLRPFHCYTYYQYAEMYGLRRLTQQACWDLVCNVELWRKRVLAAELFGQFLDGTRDADALAFFLYARRALVRELERAGIAAQVGGSPKKPSRGFAFQKLSRSPVQGRGARRQRRIDAAENISVMVPPRLCAICARKVFETPELTDVFLEALAQRADDLFKEGAELSVFLDAAVAVFQDGPGPEPRSSQAPAFGAAQAPPARRTSPPPFASVSPSGSLTDTGSAVPADASDGALGSELAFDALEPQPQPRSAGSDTSARLLVGIVRSRLERGGVQFDNDFTLEDATKLAIADDFAEVARLMQSAPPPRAPSQPPLGGFAQPAAPAAPSAPDGGQSASSTQTLHRLLQDTLTRLMAQYVSILCSSAAHALGPARLRQLEESVHRELQAAMAGVVAIVLDSGARTGQHLALPPRMANPLASREGAEYTEELRRHLVYLTRHLADMPERDRVAAVDAFCRGLLGFSALRGYIEPLASIRVTEALADTVREGSARPRRTEPALQPFGRGATPHTEAGLSRASEMEF